MKKENEALEIRVTRLEQTTASHEQRLAALEARLDPQAREQRMTADLELLLNDLAGLPQDKVMEEVNQGRPAQAGDNRKEG